MRTSHVCDVVCELIAVLPGYNGRPILLDGDLDELGLDSLDRLELLVGIEDRCHVRLTDHYLTSPSIGELIIAIGEAAADRAAGRSNARELMQ